MDDPDHNTVWCAEWLGLGPWMVWQINARRRGAGAIRRPCGAIFQVVCFNTVLFCSVLPKIYISNTSLQERERKTFLGNTRIDVIPIYIRRTMPHYLHSPGRGLLFIPK